MWEVLILLIVIVIIIFLLFLEYYSRDCEGGKRCSHYAVMPERNEELGTYIDKLVVAVRGNSLYVTWRSALIIALIATPVIIYILYQRLPLLWEWIILTLIIFIGGVLSSLWLYNKFLYPNTKKIEESLLDLKYRQAEKGKVYENEKERKLLNFMEKSQPKWLKKLNSPWKKE